MIILFFLLKNNLPTALAKPRSLIENWGFKIVKVEKLWINEKKEVSKIAKKNTHAEKQR